MTETQATQRNDGQAAASPGPVFASILCAVDGTRGSSAAVKQAATLAGPRGHLTLLAVTAVTGSGAYRSAAISPARAKRLLDHAAGIADEAGVPSTLVVDPASPPSQVILDRAAHHDLLAMGAPATSWLGGMFIGGVAVAALGSFTTPLLAARSTPTGHDFPNSIAVASDGLDGSDHLVDLAARLAHPRGANVTLVHVLEDESRARPRRIDEQARRLELAVPGRIELRVQAGAARAVIVEVAKSVNASLVVMGSRRLDGLRALGSVSRRVVHEVYCSVLLLPPEHLHD
jgi:nucleotide-binding universal stress UspA family protein